MSSYYQWISRDSQPDPTLSDHQRVVSRYQPTQLAQGAWNDHEQHMAPATGLLIYELCQYQPKVHLQLARISLDILGLIGLQETTITTRCLRPGRSIELIEATMTVAGRDCITARAWRLLTQNSGAIAGLEDAPATTDPHELPEWEDMKHWPGGFVHSLQVRAEPTRRAGKGLVWVSSAHPLIADHNIPEVAKLLTFADTANGIVPRTGLQFEHGQWMFPNIDLQLHMHRLPTGDWLGIEAVQQMGERGVGLTSAVLHDLNGPFARSEQILTVRPLPDTNQ